MALKAECDRCKHQAKPDTSDGLPDGWRRVSCIESGDVGAVLGPSRRDLCESCTEVFWDFMAGKAAAAV